MKLVVRDSDGTAVLRSLAAICAVVLLLGAGGIYWQYTSYTALRSRVQAAEQQAEEGRTIARRLEQTQQQHQNVRQKLQHLELSVSERAYIPTLLKQLETSAKSCRLMVLSVRPSNTQPTVQQDSDEQKKEEKKPAEPYERQVIDVSVRGQFWDVMRFTENLTRFPKILAVERVQLRPRQRKAPTDPFEVEAQFTLTAFIFRTTGGGAQP